MIEDDPNANRLCERYSETRESKYMRNILKGLGVAFAILVGAAVVNAYPAERDVRELSPVAQVLAKQPALKEGEEKTARGTAFKISDNRYMTAAHVVSGAESIRLILSDGEEKLFQVLYINVVQDVAILLGPDTPGIPTSVLVCSEAEVDTPVYMISHPLGVPFPVKTHGTIATLPKTLGGPGPIVWKGYLADLTGGKGSSGAPVSLEDGKGVIGMLVGGVGAVSPLSSVLSAPVLCNARDNADGQA